MATTTDEKRTSQETSQEEGSSSDMERKMYLRFAAMIVTGMFVMYWTMFVGSYELSHIRFSQSRVYMALVMGGAMTLVMLGWMLHMYKNTKVNIGIVVVGLLLLGVGTFLDRSQATVGDVEFMQGMIPHHSLAITRSERFNVDDVRVCDLAVSISEAQRREIDEMDWLIDDIQDNGPASTREEAEARPVPTFAADAVTECDPD
jgi:Domain of unknown function (DUF305)